MRAAENVGEREKTEVGAIGWQPLCLKVSNSLRFHSTFVQDP